jgi:alkaline phosphatase
MIRKNVITFNIAFIVFFTLIIYYNGAAQDLKEKNKYQQEISPLGYKGNEFFSESKIPRVLLNRSIGKESHIIWGTNNHTSSPVPIGSVGPLKYISQLKGIIPNTKIAKVMKEAIKDGVNVILVVGDGMGINHMSLPIYMNIAEGNNQITYFEKIMQEGQSGIVLTNPYNGLVTCSSAAATAIACGSKTLLNIVGLDHNGFKIESALETAIKENYATGLVSDASITDATPACFYAHHVFRGDENLIAVQLVQNDKIKVIFGGGACHFIPKGKKLKDNQEFSDFDEWQNNKSERNDTLNLINSMKEKGYKIINTKEELSKIDISTEKVLGLFSGGGITAAIDRENKKTLEPSVIMMADKDLEILSKDGRKYFTMIECARIDWEAHDNDAGAVYKAVNEMNYVLEKCYDYYSKNKSNTLLIFTADHETGSLGITYTKLSEEKKYKETLSSGEDWQSNTDPLLFKNFLKLKQQKKTISKILDSAKSSKELYDLLKENLGYSVSEEDIKHIINLINRDQKGK